jgi:hypothetical protein
MSDMNGVGRGIDLGAVRARQAAKERAPEYDPGTPDFTLQVFAPLVGGEVSFSAALDNTATALDLDGWQIETVRSAAVVGVNPEQGVAAFQVTLQVRRKDTD